MANLLWTVVKVWAYTSRW